MYFVMRNTVDGLPANDTKAIDVSAHNLFCTYTGIMYHHWHKNQGGWGGGQ